MIKKPDTATIFEWVGVITAIIYTLFVASNAGLEFIGFCLLLVSSIGIGVWAYLRNQRGGVLILQFFYGSLALFGMWRWF